MTPLAVAEVVTAAGLDAIGAVLWNVFAVLGIVWAACMVTGGVYLTVLLRTRRKEPLRLVVVPEMVIDDALPRILRRKGDDRG